MPILNTLVIGEFTLFRPPCFFDCAIETFNKEFAVASKLVYGVIASACFYLVPRQRLIVGQNIENWQEALFWENRYLVDSLVSLIIENVAQEFRD